jgi:hypothetical protein
MYNFFHIQQKHNTKDEVVELVTNLAATWDGRDFLGLV